MKDVRDAMAKILDSTTLADVLNQIDHAEETQKGVINFCI